MPIRLALSRRFAHLDPTLPVVDRSTFIARGFDVTIMHVDEDEPWVNSKYRLLRPMFLVSEEECRRALDYFKQQRDGAAD